MVSNIRFMNKIFRTSVLLLLIGCAAVSPPSGGPKDITPPSLLSVDPPSGTTNITSNFSVVLTFSERLDESTLDKAFRIAPVLDVPLDIQLKREKATVTFPDNLVIDQTYIITIDRDLMDEHKNRLDQTYQHAFSTGSEIAKGEIRGKIDNPYDKSSTLFLYRVNGNALDSLFTTNPDYYSESDDKGFYHFSFLEPGDYQVLAVGASVGPVPINPVRMSYGVHWKSPLTISSSTDTLRNVNMRVHRESTALNVVAAHMETRCRGVIRFTNPVSLKNQKQPSIVLQIEITGDTIIPELVHQYVDGSNEIHFHTSQLKPGEEVRLIISGIVDSLDQELELFKGEVAIPEADTSDLEIIHPAPGKTINIHPEQTFEIQFSDIVTVDMSDTLIRIQRKDGVFFSPIIIWDNPTQLTLVPEGGWESEKNYEVMLFGHHFIGPTGVPLPDSVVVFKVSVGKEVGYGGIMGFVLWEYSDNAVVAAKSIEKPQKIHQTDVNFDGSYEFKSLPSGFWLLSTFQDVNMDGRYSFGRAVEFQPSEPFLDYPDTVEVRANWIIEGITIKRGKKQ